MAYGTKKIKTSKKIKKKVVKRKKKKA